jgi:hypothetical protein
MIDAIKEQPINNTIHLEKINETNKMINETLKLINNYKEKIIKEKKNNTNCFRVQ